jgi:endonuclease/exonuclease/phosphatase family metal-dependent hydrolase
MKKIFLLVLIVSTVGVNAQLIKLITYNIRLEIASDGDNDWNHRREMFAGQINFYQPDIWGVQEATPNQMNYLDTVLTKYKHVGIGRDGENKGEASAIFYNHTKFTVLQSNTFWLSPTPDTISKGWDASYIRICTYALMRDKKTKKRFWVFNTHLDNNGVIAREKGVELILKKMTELNTKNMPVIFMGDFNTEPETNVIKSLSTQMNNTREISTSKPFGPSGTFNAFEFCKPVVRTIDYIFVSKLPQIVVNKYAVLSDNINMHYLSDHFPVYVELRLN